MPLLSFSRPVATLIAAMALACALVLVVAATGSAVTPAGGGSRPLVTAGSRYLALGDSVPFGFVEPQVVPPPNYMNAAAFLGFPEHLGRRLRLRVTNAACPGETSSSFINASAQSNGCENNIPPQAGAYRWQFPLHVRYRGSQLHYAVGFLRRHPRTRLISLMIGANDLFLCQKKTPDACADPAEQRATLATIASNVRRILSAIRHRARYRGQLAIVNYYSLNYASPTVNSFSASINRAVDAAAKPYRVAIADGFGELRAAAARSGGNSCTAGLLTQLGQPAVCGIHPSYAGQALLAQALEKVLRH